MEGTKEDCSSKFVDKLGTVSWASGGSHSVCLPQVFLCKSNDSLSHIIRPEKFTCVADVCSDVLKLDNSVVSDCGDTQLREGDTSTATGVLGYVFGVGDNRVNVLLPAGWCGVRNTACLRTCAMFTFRA